MEKISAPFKGFKNELYPKGSCTQLFGENPALYGQMGMKGHNGEDYVAPYGTPMNAIKGGYICDIAYNPETGYGNEVRIRTKDNEVWIYAHMSKVVVKLNQVVEAGDYIGDMGNCFDKETEILTDMGWKKFCDLDHTEFVATLNPETQEIEYHKPYSYTKKKEKYINYFRNYHSLDIAVTDNHTMYVELQDGKMHFKNFEDLPKYSFIKQNGGIWNGEELSSFIIPEVSFKLGQKRKELVIEMDYWLSFLGWFITDGSICNKNTVRITQSFNNAHKRKIIEDIFDNLPFDIKTYKEDYIIYSKQLADLLKKLCPQKSIPSFIFNLSSRQIRIFLEAFWLGDGWKHKTTKYYITPIKESADDLQELIMKCGGYAVIQKRDPLLVNRKKPAMIGNQEVVSKKPYYIITEGQHRMGMIKKNMVERKEYNDFAYCITVKNHIIYIRRNGRPMWCGNTGFVVSCIDANGFWVKGSNKNAGTHLHTAKRKVHDYVQGVDVSWHGTHKGIPYVVENLDNGFNGWMSVKEDLDKIEVITKEKLSDMIRGKGIVEALKIVLKYFTIHRL